jgi:hypothetical protein
MSSLAVVIPTRSLSPYLRASVESALRQDRPFDEIVVFGNGLAEAELRSFLGGMPKGMLRLVAVPDRLPPHSSWNTAVGYVASERALFLGDDDVLLPGAGRIIRELDDRDRLVTFGYELMNSAGNRFALVVPPVEKCNFEDFYRLLIGTGSLGLMLGGVVFRPSWLRATGGFRPVPFSNAWFIDTDCWLALARLAGGTRHHREIVWSYRINSGQMGYGSDLGKFEEELHQYMDNHEVMARGWGLAADKIFGGSRRMFSARLMSVRASVSVKNRIVNGELRGFEWVWLLLRQPRLPFPIRIRLVLGCLKLKTCLLRRNTASQL